MGLDRFANFISKSINNDGIEEVNIDSNLRKIIANHIIFDLNFLFYQEIIEIENEINDIIKIILCLPFSLNKYEILENLLKHIFTQKHWKPYYISEHILPNNDNVNLIDLETLFDGFNEDEIIQKFIKFITKKSIPSTNDIMLSIVELVVYEKIINVLIKYIEDIHYINFVQSLSIFYDGIPSFSKVIEQRKRRIKNFLEANKKKELFKKYFEQLKTNNKNLFESISKQYIDNNDEVILFDYFKWIKNRFSIDKSIGPSSNFIKNLELFMNTKLQQKFPKINIYINSAKENGESDLKIFKYISNNELTGEYSIHTTDSDLVHQILLQQTYYKIINKDINFNVIKYLKNVNLLGYAQILEANTITKKILELYNTINNIKTNNYKIIWDLCLIFYFFGNDHLPSSIEIGPELGLEFFIKKHYEALNKNNIINFKKDDISIDLNNLKLYLAKINETNANNITKIILQRFFKINSQLINLFVNKLDYDFQGILDFLKIFITIKSALLDNHTLDELDIADLRKKFMDDTIKNLINIDKSLLSNEKTFEQTVFELCLNKLNFDKTKINLILENIQLIEENISYYENEFNGLILYSKPIDISSDPYQDLYNYISDKTINILSKQYPIYYDHIDIHYHLHIKNNELISQNITNNNNCEDYLKKLYHLVITQFGNMGNFHSDNLIWYKQYIVPSINSLIDFINNIPDDYNQNKIWFKDINNNNISTCNYLNSINHHLIITPFISFYNLPLEIKNIINKIEHIDNLWIEDINNFNYRDIDIKKFFKIWDEALIKVSQNSNKISEDIINLNLTFD